MICNLYSNYIYITEAHGTIASYLEYLEQAESAGYTVRVVNPRAYEHLFSSEYCKDRMFYNATAVIFLVLLLSDIFTFEERNQTKTVVFATKNGRKKLFGAKINIAMILSLLVFVMVYGVHLLHIDSLFAIEKLNISIQSIQTFADFSLPLTTGEFLLLNLTLRAVILMEAAVFICFAGANIKKEAFVAASCLIVFILPEVLSVFGIGLLDNFSLLKILDSPLVDYKNAMSISVVGAIICAFLCKKSKKGNYYGYFT